MLPSPSTLAPTALIDSDHPAVVAFAAGHARGADDRERAVALYLAVRDGFRYDPYRIDLSPAGMRASSGRLQPGASTSICAWGCCSRNVLNRACAMTMSPTQAGPITRMCSDMVDGAGVVASHLTGVSHSGNWLRRPLT